MAIVADILRRRTMNTLGVWGQSLSLVERNIQEATRSLVARINVPYNNSSPPDLKQANTVDPWNQSGKYALGWVYFCIILLVGAMVLHIFHAFTDRIRTAIHEDELHYASQASSPDDDYELPALPTDKSTTKFFPHVGEIPQSAVMEEQDAFAPFRRPINFVIAFCRYFFYRPIPELRWSKKYKPIEFPALSIVLLMIVAVAFVCLYTFVPQPLYWKTLADGSPPVAIRAGMLAISLMPWIIAMSMKANIVTFLTGIGHERLNVLHRWTAYLCLLLSLIHTIPFYVQGASDPVGNATFQGYFNRQNMYIYGSGIACLVPLILLCLQSLPIIRKKAYELFVVIHIPLSIIFTAMLFWHCNNYLSSWAYLYATITIWITSYLGRLIFLNWTRPWRMSWLIGEDATVTTLPEDAVKITIPTQMKWRPGQYVYLRMPGISVTESHPFTIASLWSDDFPSEYGEDYKDMILVFRPFGGFTKRVLEAGHEKGPYHTYRAFVDGPYGGMKRSLASFDHVVLIAGGSGITAIVSQLLDLIRRMRDGKAITKTVRVIWALKRPETMEWFKEELRICRTYAPPDSVSCQFFITASKRMGPRSTYVPGQNTQSEFSSKMHDRLNASFQGVAEKRASWHSKRNSAYIQEEANGDPEVEKVLRDENEDTIAPLPQAHIIQMGAAQNQHDSPTRNFSRPASSGSDTEHHVDLRRNLNDDIATAVRAGNAGMLDPSLTRHYKPTTDLPRLDTKTHHDNTLAQLTSPTPTSATALLTGKTFSTISAPQSAVTPTTHQKYPSFPGPEQQNQQDIEEQPYSFGFPSTPTEFQKNLMRFAFLPAAARRPVDGWTTEYGRPDLPYMLRQMAQSQNFSKRTAVFVCGPASMRVAAARAVAGLQSKVLKGECEEVFLHTENYAL